jgi:predicted ATPase/DNA-binding SARP family transcriptional activator/Tfp pilus assembly protein PilF
MAQRSITLLGSFQVQRDGVAVTRFHGDKVRALLAYLAVESDRPHARGALAGLLWPEQPDDHALRNLTQALVRLREALGAGDELLHATRQAVQWRDGAADVDVVEFARLGRSAEPADLARAAALYRGEFLAGFALPGCEAFEEWLLLTREQLQLHMLAVLHTLAEQHLAAARAAHAAEAARRQLALDPWREDAHRQLMQALAVAGDRAAALAAYARCRQVLTEELGAEPDAATTALYEQIAAGQLGPRGRPPPADAVMPPTPPNNLPSPLTTFIGRDMELAQLAARLKSRECRLLTLVGPGGVGKTRLARELAVQVLPDFVDGVFFVALAPLDRAEMAPPAIAQAIGLREEAGQPLIETLRAWLRDRRLLLLLDNFEHLLAAAELVATLLAAAPRLKVLITSREPLGVPGEHIFAVPTLAPPDPAHLPQLDTLAQNAAVGLFVARAQAAEFDFTLSLANAPTIVEICRRLDGLPLAIELAAARVRLLPPTALLARLAHRLDLLAVGGRDHPARQQTMRGTIAWSYDLLGAAEQALFRRVAVCAGGFTLAAAEAICAEGKRQKAKGKNADSGSLLPFTFYLLPFLEALVDKSLLLQVEHAGEARFMMLETIREYGLEQLAASGESQTARLAHARYYLALAEQAAPELLGRERDMWLDLLAAEHDNLRAALAWSLEDVETRDARQETQDGRHEAEECRLPVSLSSVSATRPEIGLRLVGALTWFWSLRCYLSEGSDWTSSALQRSSAAGSTTARAQALYGAGILAIHQGDYAAAAPHLDQALAIFRAVADQHSIGRALMNRGFVAYNLGDYTVARTLLEQSLPILRAVGDTSARAHALSTLGLVAWLQADYPRAQALHQESLNLQRQLGDKWSIAGALGNLGLVAWTQGDYAAARAYHEESLSLRRELEDQLGVAYSLSSLGLVHMHQGDYSAARAYHEESLSLRRELGFKWGIADSLRNLGLVAHAEEDHMRAAELLQAGLGLFRDLGAKKDAVECLEGLAAAGSAQGQPAQAVRLYGAVEALRESFEFPRPPVFRGDYELGLLELQTQLDEQAFRSAWAEGRAMNLEAAIVYALSSAGRLATYQR